MINPKAQSWSFMGASHQSNDDVALLNPEQGIYVICDGVSEGGQGKFASTFVSRSIQEGLIESNLKLKKNGNQLVGAKRLQAMQEMLLGVFSETQSNLSLETEKNPELKKASTTCITLWLDGRFGIMAHVGDSRAYLHRGGKIYQLTKDHSGLEELISMGQTLEQAKANPLSRGLTRAMGSAGATHPDIFKIEFQPNDLLLMCTDGVYSSFQQNSLQQFVHVVYEGKQDVKELINRCSHNSGDDSTMIQINFPVQTDQEAPLLAADRIKLIQQTPLCRYLDYIQKSHIAAICEVEQFSAGSLILQEETEGETMYIIAKGTLEVLIKGQHVLYRKSGEYFGEIALIQELKRTATVIAKEDSILLSLKRHDLFEVFKKDLLMEKHFYRAMLEATLDRLVQQGIEIANMRSL